MKFRLREWKYDSEAVGAHAPKEEPKQLITLESIRLPNFVSDFAKMNIWDGLFTAGIKISEHKFWMNTENDQDRYLPKIDRNDFVYVIQHTGSDLDVIPVRPNELNAVLPIVKTKENLFDLGYKVNDIIAEDFIVYNSNELLVLVRDSASSNTVKQVRWDFGKTKYAGSSIEKTLNNLLPVVQERINQAI